MSDPIEQAIPANDTADQPEAKTFKYTKTYQPKDADGNPIGRAQVFESDDPQEVIDKIAHAHEMATRRMHELRKHVTGDQQELGFQFKEETLSDDERWEIAQSINDPSRMDKALDRALEARFGAPISKVREVLNKTVETDQTQRAMAETQAFVNETPEYKICKENQAAMQKYMVDNKLAWNRKNLSIAFESLAADGLVDVEETNALPSEGTQVTTEPEPQTVEPIAPTAPAVVTRPRGTTSSSLFRDHSSAIPGSGAGAGKKSDEEFAKQLAKMPQAELRRRLSDPTFRARVDALGKK
jgi:hypothetical protein